MITVMTTAKVTYACYLSDEDNAKVKAYAEEHDCSLKNAVKKLYGMYEIDLYADSDKMDFCTQSIDRVDEEEED